MSQKGGKGKANAQGNKGKGSEDSAMEILQPSKGQGRTYCSVQTRLDQRLQLQDIFRHVHPAKGNQKVSDQTVEYKRLELSEPFVCCPKGHFVYLSRIPFQAGCHHKECKEFNGWPQWIIREYIISLLQQLPWTSEKDGVCSFFHTPQFLHNRALKLENDKNKPAGASESAQKPAQPHPRGMWAPKPKPETFQKDTQTDEKGPVVNKLSALDSICCKSDLEDFLDMFEDKFHKDSEDLFELIDDCSGWEKSLSRAEDLAADNINELQSQLEKALEDQSQLKNLSVKLSALKGLAKEKTSERKDKNIRQMLLVMQEQNISVDDVLKQMKLLESQKQEKKEGSQDAASGSEAKRAKTDTT